MQAMITRHITLQDISMAILVKTRVLIIENACMGGFFILMVQYKAKRAVGKEDGKKSD
jgi:hypothetical protein